MIAVLGQLQVCVWKRCSCLVIRTHPSPATCEEHFSCRQEYQRQPLRRVFIAALSEEEIVVFIMAALIMESGDRLRVEPEGDMGRALHN